MKLPRCIIFDFDGTLANTFDLLYEIFRQVLGEYGQPRLSDEEINAQFGPTEEVSMRNLMAGHPQCEAAVQRMLELYDSRHEEFVPPVPEVDAMLCRLRQEGHTLGIFTGKARKTYEISARHLFQHRHFASIVTGDDVTRAKPAPEGLLKAIAECGSSPAQALFIGDSDSDQLAGKAAGVKTWRCTWLGDLAGFAAPQISAERTLENLCELWETQASEAPAAS